MTSTSKDISVLSMLREIEAEMKSIGYWSDNPPSFEAKNYLDAPSFELWLQCVFIPNVLKAAERHSYPSSSSVGQMAMKQYDYHSFVPEAQKLLQLLYEFDQLIEAE